MSKRQTVNPLIFLQNKYKRIRIKKRSSFRFKKAPFCVKPEKQDTVTPNVGNERTPSKSKTKKKTEKKKKKAIYSTEFNSGVGNLLGGGVGNPAVESGVPPSYPMHVRSTCRKAFLSIGLGRK